MNIQQYLEKFKRITEKPTLNTMYWLMEKFQNPQNRGTVIHVAGTNGKGSIVAMLNRVLVDQGYKVGKYISPHLIQFNERICVNDVPISDQEIEEILKEMDPIINLYNQTHEIPVRHFEVITSLAFIYFARKNCDFILLETGMGGILDCTNIVNPLISIITSIGYDHMKVLGNTLTEIAEKKAGIIKQNSNTIFLELENRQENEEVFPVIQNKCKELQNQLYYLKREEITNYREQGELQYFTYDHQDISTNLKGKIQIYYTAMCLKALEIIKQKGFSIQDFKAIESLRNVKHPGRFEKLNQFPTIIFDGAHNEPAIQNFIGNMEQYYSNQKKIYIVSILKKKDYKKMLYYLAQDKEAIIYVTDGNDQNLYSTKQCLYKACEEYKPKQMIKMANFSDAIQEATCLYPDRVIGIVGSFYTYPNAIQTIKQLNQFTKSDKYQ